MTNSLIPYSFIPGTKAMASEVNANFIALAKAVDEGKTFTTESIEQFNKELEERLDESLDSKLEVDLSNSLSISNCVLEVSEHIRMENIGTNLVIKAGTKAILPNGFEEDGITPKFEDYEFLTDTAVTMGASGAVLFLWNVKVNEPCRMAATQCYSGSTPPTSPANLAVWYDTSTNTVKRYVNSVWTKNDYTLPLGILYYANSSTPAKITHVFNGFGFIGQCTWVDKGVKVLFADGRNPDGTLKNKNFVSDKITVTNLSNQISQLGQLRIRNNSLCLLGYGVTNYFEQETTPSGFGQYATWYNTRENEIYETSDSGANWSKVHTIVLHKLTKSTATGAISDISMAYTLKIADINDVIKRIAMPVAKAANGYTKLPNGIILQWGRYTAGSDGQTRTITFPTPFSNTSYSAMVTQDTMGGDWYNAWYYAVSYRGTASMNVYARLNGCAFNWMAIGY